MSYSFNILAASTVLAAAAVSAKLDEEVGRQPIHEADKAQALAATESLLPLLRQPEADEQISVSVSGSVSKYRAEDDGFNTVSLSVNAHVVKKPADQASG